MFDDARDPIDLLVVGEHVVFEIGDFDVPRGDGTVDQRLAAASGEKDELYERARQRSADEKHQELMAHKRLGHQ